MSMRPADAPIVAATPPRALVILGQPVAQSLSPVFQNAALSASNFTVQYARCEVSAADLPAELTRCRSALCGGNVTMPHKRAVFELAHDHSAAARRTGAVNTFWWEDGRLVGHNTDVDGVLATIRALCPHGVPGDVVLLGAGGSAAAVLVAVAGADRVAGGRTIVLARTRARAEDLVRHVAPDAMVATDVASIDWTRVSLVINATPLGMQPHDDLPLDLTLLDRHTAVFDLVYKREGTRWVQAANARGHAAEDGLRMLVEQGAAAFECWFGVPAPRDVMWHALGADTPRADRPRSSGR